MWEPCNLLAPIEFLLEILEIVVGVLLLGVQQNNI